MQHPIYQRLKAHYARQHTDPQRITHIRVHPKEHPKSHKTLRDSVVGAIEHIYVLFSDIMSNFVIRYGTKTINIWKTKRHNYRKTPIGN